MKKVRAILLMTVVSITFASNVFASGAATASVLDLFSGLVEYTVSLLRDDSCPLRQCTNCRPTERDENGNCRPRD